MAPGAQQPRAHSSPGECCSRCPAAHPACRTSSQGGRGGGQGLPAPQQHHAQGYWDSEDFTVVDTADIFNPGCDSSEMRQEIIRCIRLSSPGPHALLLVTQLGRFTQEKVKAAERLQDIFGADVFRHTIVIFTRAEELVGGLLQDYVKYSKNRALCELIERCGNRYCGFNNWAVGAERDHQVMELMGMVRCMVWVNGDWYYSNEMYLEPNLTEEKVAYHMARYRVGMVKREREKSGMKSEEGAEGQLSWLVG
ncbi:GTPase IMAP family member 6-like [Anas acuta]|uniref:GTPase IMAP family member 6-like n=1 Tax=Anas acuta TaxID=28680 RepID=UPI0035C8C6B0